MGSFAAFFDNTPAQKLALDAWKVVQNVASHVRSRRQELETWKNEVQTKSSATDPVTVVDKEAEALVRELLLQIRPKDSVLGEESPNINLEENVSSSINSKSGEIRLEDSLHWIVDPIDGTVNYIYGLPAYAVSLACVYQGEVVAAAVADVYHEQTYVAAKDSGAYLVHDAGTYRKLKCNNPLSLEQAIIATGFTYKKELRKVQGDLLSKMIGKVRDVRRIGSAAIDLCAVGAGIVDGYYEHALNCWDYAGGLLVAKEAGAKSINVDISVPGTDLVLTLVTAPEIFAPLYEEIKTYNMHKTLLSESSSKAKPNL